MQSFLKTNQKKLSVDLICVDLDHTLLGFNEYEINQETAKVIAKVIEMNKKFLVVTGRSLLHSLVVSKQLKLPYHICFGGALVYDLKMEKIVFSQHFLPETNLFLQKSLQKWEKKLCATLYSLNKEETAVQCYFKGQINESFKGFKIPVQDFLQAKTWQVLNAAKFLRIGLFAEPEVLDKIFATLKEKPNLLHVVRNYPTVIEVTGPNVNKSKGVEFVQKKFNLDWKKTLVIGDSYNDLILFKKTKYSIAVNNAVSALKERAYAITTDFDNQGVAKALKKWVLPEENAK